MTTISLKMVEVKIIVILSVAQLVTTGIFSQFEFSQVLNGSTAQNQHRNLRTNVKSEIKSEIDRSLTAQWWPIHRVDALFTISYLIFTEFFAKFWTILVLPSKVINI